jgi:ribosomal protein L31E
MNAGRAYRKAFREYEKLPRWKRALGAVNPASLFMRARRRLAVCKVWLEKTLRTKVKALRVFRGKR